MKTSQRRWQVPATLVPFGICMNKIVELDGGFHLFTLDSEANFWEFS